MKVNAEGNLYLPNKKELTILHKFFKESRLNASGHYHAIGLYFLDTRYTPFFGGQIERLVSLRIDTLIDRLHNSDKKVVARKLKSFVEKDKTGNTMTRVSKDFLKNAIKGSGAFYTDYFVFNTSNLARMSEYDIRGCIEFIKAHIGQKANKAAPMLLAFFQNALMNRLEGGSSLRRHSSYKKIRTHKTSPARPKRKRNPFDVIEPPSRGFYDAIEPSSSGVYDAVLESLRERTLTNPTEF